MKKLRKLLAVILAMVMLMASLPMVSTSAFSIYPELKLDELTDVHVGELGVMYSFSPESDGWYKFYSLGEADTYARLYQGITMIGNVDDSLEDQNFVMVIKLEAGKTYTMKIGAHVADKEYVDFQIGVEESVGVEAMEITQYPYNMTAIEGYEFETIDPTGLEITFTLSDGSTVDWNYEEYGMVGDFEVYVFPEEIADGEYCLYIECGAAIEEIQFTVIENPIESIEYSCETPIEFYEHSGGYFVDDETYEYFYTIPEDAMITINYKDGTSETVNYFELEGIYDDCDQMEQPWTVGENYITLFYYGMETTIPVTILPSPFVNITVNSAPSREYVFGDYDDGYLDEEGVYTLWPIDITGLSFTVEYEDGSTQTFDDDDFDTENMMIDGYEYFVKDVVVTECGAADVILCYKGAEITYQVNVVETDIESIEVLKAPDKAECEYGYYADFTGAVIKINYKDGTSAQATADENTIGYYYDGAVVCTILVGDDVVSIFNEEDMETGERHDYLTCAGVGLVYNGVNYIEGREIASVTADNVTMSGYDMVVTVEYADGSEEVLPLDVISSFTVYDQYTEACAMTENGVVTFSIEKWEDSTGELLGYNVYMLDNEYFVEASPAPSDNLGDVDGDGSVTVIDATLIQRAVAGLEELSDEVVTIADVDCDGSVTIMDATAIQRIVAGLE